MVPPVSKAFGWAAAATTLVSSICIPSGMAIAAQDFPPLDAPGPASAGGESASAGQRSPAWTFAAFARAETATLNNRSRLNPGNAVFNAKAKGSYLETRLNASDTFGDGQQGRWQFKSYSTSSHASPSVAGVHSRVDELYVDWKSPKWFATVGKRRLNWGHALAFNPVNVVAPARNPLDPSFATEGQPIGWLSLSGATVLDVLVTQASKRDTYSGDRPRLGARWSARGDGKDAALYAFGGGPYPDGRRFPRMLGASFSMNAIPGLTLYGELANFSNNYRNYHGPQGTRYTKQGSFSQAALGSQLDLGGKSSAFVELFVNGAGYSARERFGYLQALDTGMASRSAGTTTADFVPLSLNRQYLLLGYRKEYREKYSGSVNILVARDGSFSNRFEAAYTVSDYVELKLSYFVDGGGRGTEFGNTLYKKLLQFQLNASY